MADRRAGQPWAERFRLSGPSVVLDARINAVRPDIADIALASRIFAPHYSLPEHCACTARSMMLRATPDETAPAVSQLLHGEGFAVVDRAGAWAWGYGLHDNYVGYVLSAALGPVATANHIVSVATAPVFSRPDIKSATRDGLSISARVAGILQGDFLAMESGFLHRRHVLPSSDRESDPVSVAERLIGAPYLWGGRGDGGIDCSGLVQCALGLAGIAAPRDSDQQRALGNEVDPSVELTRGDIILFPGHVGLMVDAEHLIHANAHWMAVKVEKLKDVTDRGAEIVARRRIVS